MITRSNTAQSAGVARTFVRDLRAAKLNIGRQAVIKTLLGRVLEEERSDKTRSNRKAG
jgi:hypothetical protein